MVNMTSEYVSSRDTNLYVSEALASEIEERNAPYLSPWLEIVEEASEERFALDCERIEISYGR